MIRKRNLGLNGQLTTLHSNVKLIGGWICNKIVEVCARVQLKDVSKSLSVLKSTAPGGKMVNQSPSVEQHSGLDNDIMVDSDSDAHEADQNTRNQADTIGFKDDSAPLGDGEPERERRTPRQRKRKIPRNKMARHRHQVEAEANHVQEVKGTNEPQLRRTMAPAPDEARYKHSCNWPNCSKYFSQKSSLVRHQRTHTGVKPFKCKWPNCGKSFSVSATCTDHRRTHTGEKPFACTWPKCDYSFAARSNLKAHRRTHTGEKPYACTWPNCDNSFAARSNLTIHRRIHTGERPFKCGLCDYRSAHGSHVTRHTRVHSGEKPYKCRVCAATFTQSSSKIRHEKIHHRSH